jgi:site-specific recombinase XerD
MVAELAGHADIRTTQIYIHVAGRIDHLKAAIEKGTAHSAYRNGVNGHP